MESLRAFFQTTDITFVVPEDIIKEIWFKFMINVSLNQWSALLKLTYRIFQIDPYAQELLRRTMEEVIELSRYECKKLGSTALSLEDIDRAIGVIKTLAPQGKTSMLQDVEAHRRTEVDAFAGAIVRRSRAEGNEVPLNAALYAAIKALEDSYLQIER